MKPSRPMHPGPSSRRLLHTLVAISLIPVAPMICHAGTIKETFSSPLDGLPQNWVVHYQDEGARLFEPFITDHPDGGSYLKLETGGADSTRSVAVAYTGPDNEVADLEGSVVVRFGTDGVHRFSVVLRASEEDFADHKASRDRGRQPGYAITLIHRDDNEYPKYFALTMHAVSSSPNNPDSTLHLGHAYIDHDAFSTDTDYLLKFSLLGSEGRASLWTTGENPELLGEIEVHSLRTLERGFFGLRHAPSSYQQTAYVKSFELLDVSQ